MGILSLENTDRLYWLGRYSERVYTTIRLFFLSFDRLLDLEGDDMAHIARFCKDLEIPNVYPAKEDFLSHYCFDDRDPNSIRSNLLGPMTSASPSGRRSAAKRWPISSWPSMSCKRRGSPPPRWWSCKR